MKSEQSWFYDVTMQSRAAKPRKRRRKKSDLGKRTKPLVMIQISLAAEQWVWFIFFDRTSKTICLNIDSFSQSNMYVCIAVFETILRVKIWNQIVWWVPLCVSCLFYNKSNVTNKYESLFNKL